MDEGQKQSHFDEVADVESWLSSLGRLATGVAAVNAAPLELAVNGAVRERLEQNSEAVAGKPVDQRWVFLDTEKARLDSKLDDPIPAPWKQKPRTVSYMDVRDDEGVMREMAISKALSKAVYGSKEEENKTDIESGRQVFYGDSSESFYPMEGTRSAVWDGTSKGTGLGAQAFESQSVDGSGRTVVCAYAGTSNVDDAGVDLKNFAGFSTLQYEAGQAWLRDRLEEVASSPKKTKELVIAGHSLGGGLALSSALSPVNMEMIEKLESAGIKVKILTWNTAGLSPVKEDEMKALPYAVSSKIKNFINEGEPVSNFGIVPGHKVIVPAEKRTRGLACADLDMVGADAKMSHAENEGLSSAFSMENLNAHKMDQATNNLLSAEISEALAESAMPSPAGLEFGKLGAWRKRRGLGLLGATDGVALPPKKNPGM